MKNSNVKMLNSDMHVLIAEIHKFIRRGLKEPSKYITYRNSMRCVLKDIDIGILALFLASSWTS